MSAVNSTVSAEEEKETASISAAVHEPADDDKDDEAVEEDDNAYGERWGTGCLTPFDRSVQELDAEE
ncbi:hypothetical protein IV203_000614 [Nitzschia inconspicua]|uniref:Uncharacterized protein n=1 Tax=Nitzschia inconspicua TaxID=303405 RepID=A0A9K3L5H5_9STRA|nr:hypothetical protein IV203_000614 [Nitzschia inconspicua]